MATPTQARIPPSQDLVPTTLPPGRFNEATEYGSYHAYEICRSLEQGSLDQSQKAKATKAKDEKQLQWQVVYARVLGYLLLYAPCDDGRIYVEEEISRCDGRHDDLLELGKKWTDHLLQAFCQPIRETPKPSEHPSRPSFEYETSLFTGILDKSPTNHADAKKMALRRDGHKCLITGAYDSVYMKSLRLTGQARPAVSVASAPTNAAHIFPPYLNENLLPGSDDPKTAGHQTEWSRCVWAQILNFAHINALDDLNGAQIHRLGNILTLRTDLRSLFDRLDIWFEEDQNDPDPASNTYIVCASSADYLAGITRRVTFGIADDAGNHQQLDLELPNRRFLRLHAAVCRIAHLSGAAEYIEKYDRDAEESSVLAADGSSADFLTMRLLTSTAVRHVSVGA